MSQMDIKDLDFQELLSKQDLVTVVGGMPPEGYGSLDDTTTVIATQTVGIQEILLELDTSLDTTGWHEPPRMCVPSDLPPYYICS